MKTYHKIILTALILLFQIGPAWGDEVDRRLPVDTPQEIKQSTREVILSGVDSDRTLEVTNAMLQHNFDRRQVLRVHALLLKSQGDSENVNALINKVAEGIAKRVPPAGILGALEKVQSRQDFAATTVRLLGLREHQTARLSLLVSSGLAAGLSQDDTDAIMQAVRQRTALLNADQAYALANATFEIARDASRLGVSSQSTAELVNSALRMGFNHDQMSAMHQSFLSQSQQASPESLAHGYAAAIQQSQGVQGLNAVQGTPPGAMGPSTGGAEGAGGFGGSGGGGSGSGGGSGGGGGGSGGGGGGSGGSGGNR